MLLRVFSLVCAGLILSSCASNQRVVNVFAASSLADAMSSLETQFEAANPGVDVRINLAGSNTLRRQILDGGRVDVFVPADVSLLRGLPAAEPRVFAVNRLALVIADSARVDTTSELEEATVARCAAGVPCGDATETYLATSGVSLGVVTTETSVLAVTAKVRQGEVDAGFVYATNALATGLQELALDDPPTVELGVAALNGSELGEAFVNAMLSAEFAAKLEALGFELPEGTN